MSSSKIAALLEQNLKNAETYVAPPLLQAGFDKAKKAGKKGAIIVSCSDPRIPLDKFLGSGNHYVATIRNPGGRAVEAVPSIVILDAVGNADTIVVIHHTDCGMSHHDEKGFHDLIAAAHPEFVQSHPGFVYGALADPEKSVVEDVEFLKSFPSFVAKFQIVGLVLDTFTGILKQVV